MELTITNLNVDLSSQSLISIRQKTGRMFNKINDNVQRIKIVINDINGPKGGRDKQCRIIVHTKGMPDIIITDNQTTVMAAVNIALSRVRVTLLAKVKRKQKNKPKAASKQWAEEAA